MPWNPIKMFIKFFDNIFVSYVKRFSQGCINFKILFHFEGNNCVIEKGKIF